MTTKVKVAVRVRPTNKRGECLGATSFSIVIVMIKKLLCV